MKTIEVTRDQYLLLRALADKCEIIRSHEMLFDEEAWLKGVHEILGHLPAQTNDLEPFAIRVVIR